MISMDNSADKWLTLPELVQQADLGEFEVRRIVNQYGRFLPRRQCDDIIKYSPQTAEAVNRIASLSQRGWNMEEIEGVLISTDSHQEKIQEGQCRQVMGGAVESQDQEHGLVLSSLALMQKLISNIASLTKTLSTAMVRIKALTTENRVLRAQLARYQNPQG